MQETIHAIKQEVDEANEQRTIKATNNNPTNRPTNEKSAKARKNAQSKGDEANNKGFGPVIARLPALS